MAQGSPVAAAGRPILPNYIYQQKVMDNTEPLAFSDVAHPSNFLAALSDMRTNKELCNVCIVVDDVQIWAHKMVLAGSSPYFRAMFTGGLLESSPDGASVQEVCMHDVDVKALGTIIDFFYSARLDISEENAQELLSVAGILQISQVVDACCEFMKRNISWENCLGIAAFADSHSCNRLASTAQSYAVSHFVDVIQSDEFMSIALDQLCSLIHDENLNVHSEERVFEAALAWIKHDPETRSTGASELFRLVRFPLLSPEFLLDRVANEDVIRNNRECCDLLLEGTRYHMLPRHKLKDTTRMTPRKPSSSRHFIYAIGGISRKIAVKSCERFDVSEGKWSSIADMSEFRWGLGVAALGPHLFAAGGSDDKSRLATAERYDPFNNVWLQLTPMKENRNGVGVVAHNGYVYAIGGFNGSRPLSSAECYDSKTGAWSELPPMQFARFGVGCCVLNEQIYAIGGSDGAMLKSCEKFDPLLNKWISIAPLTTARKEIAVAALGGYIYAIGGYDYNVNYRLVERYDPTRDQWVSMASLSSLRGGAGAAVVNGFIYVIGGFDGNNCLNTVEKFDPLTNEWHPAPPMLKARDRVSVCFAQFKMKKTEQRKSPGFPTTVPPSQQAAGYNST